MDVINEDLFSLYRTEVNVCLFSQFNYSNLMFLLLLQIPQNNSFLKVSDYSYFSQFHLFLQSFCFVYFNSVIQYINTCVCYIQFIKKTSWPKAILFVLFMLFAWNFTCFVIRISPFFAYICMINCPFIFSFHI